MKGIVQLYLFHSLNESFCTIILNIEIKGLLFCDILSSGIVCDPLELENAKNIYRSSDEKKNLSISVI